ncbi:MAG: DUF2244 domain-containing protein [Chromatiales bacterium]|nr:DUF2244 domain-containing protein [Chromatiales bacterium]
MHLFEISPNSSLTSGQAAFFYLSIVVVTLTIALGFAAAGFWPILPFAGLELAILGLALRTVRRRARRRESIRIDTHEVVIRSEDGADVREHRFTRTWTRVQLVRSRVAHWPSRLLLSSRGERVEVGACLTEGERRSLKRRLAEVLAPQ